MNKVYTPSPADTSTVELPEELKLLSEKLAENTHEVWSRARLSQGWTFGEQRDDRLKKHPCLVPYEELPEEEKDYDRNTSQQALKLILTLGYEIRFKGKNL